jgi:hypothetical protein
LSAVDVVAAVDVIRLCPSAALKSACRSKADADKPAAIDALSLKLLKWL